jgi:hypothetical protein
MPGVGALGRRRAARIIGALDLAVLAAGLCAAATVQGRPTAPPGPAGPARPPALAGPTAARLAHERAAQRDLGPPPPPVAGKGMWIYVFRMTGGPEAVVRSAVEHGLSHVYVRAGSSRQGLHGLGDLRALLPLAHAAGIRVIAWYFPTLEDVAADVRASTAVLDLEVDGHRVDGFAADIETPTEGTRLERAPAYAAALRAARPDRYLVLVPPRPTPHTIRTYPYAALVPHFDAVAPMVYWGRYDPAGATTDAIAYLARFGKPVSPIGQTFDMGPYGGPKGPPPPPALEAFMSASERLGAVGVSFWSWQHTPPPLWQAIRSFPWRARGGGAPGRR